MKILKSIIVCSMLAMFTISCEQELDPIKKVKPGMDVDSPSVTINFPIAGKVVRVLPDNPVVNFTATIEDDIELKSVTFKVDDEVIGTTSSFKDYRRAVINYSKNDLADGSHTLVVEVEDMTGKTMSASRTFNKVTATPYTPMEGEVYYLQFEGTLKDEITKTNATKVGSPAYATGKIGDAYAGADKSYITLPADAFLDSPEFAVAFWYKINANPARGGIISLSATPPAEPDNNRASGFRMAREISGNMQNLFVNYGIGDKTEVWINPFQQLSPSSDWIHIAVSITDSLATIYVNNEVVKTSVTEGGIKWDGVSTLTIGSGEPNFVYWEHFSDLSLYDDMHFFNRAIKPEEVSVLYALTK